MFCSLAEIRTYTIQLHITHASIRNKIIQVVHKVIQLVSKSLLGYIFLTSKKRNEILNFSLH